MLIYFFTRLKYDTFDLQSQDAEILLYMQVFYWLLGSDTYFIVEIPMATILNMQATFIDIIFCTWVRRISIAGAPTKEYRLGNTFLVPCARKSEPANL